MLPRLLEVACYRSVFPLKTRCLAATNPNPTVVPNTMLSRPHFNICCPGIYIYISIYLYIYIYK